MSAAYAKYRAEQASIDRIIGANSGVTEQANQLQTLRERYVPLAAVQRQYAAAQAEIDRAVRMGALSEGEKVIALRTVEAAYFAQTGAINRNQQAQARLRQGAALSSHAMANLSFQLNDVATMAAMGVDPFRILATQAGQLYQILSMGEGGVRGSLSYLGSVIAGLVTPARIAALGLTGIGAAALTAGHQWASARREIDVALSGIGGAAGVTAARINVLAFAAADAGHASVGGAQQIATAIAATGRVSTDVIGEAVEISRQFAKTFGEEMPGAAERLARALADPAKGVDDLARRLGSFDDATVQTIKSMARQNDLHGAQIALMEGVRRGIISGAEATTVWERGWNSLTDTMSGYWNKLGREIDLALGGGTLEDRLRKTQREIFDNRNQSSVLRWLNRDQIERLYKEADDIANAIIERDQNNWERHLNDMSIQAGNFVRSAVDEFGKLRKIQDDLAFLDKTLSTPGVTSRMDTDTQAAMWRARESLILKEVEARKSALDVTKEDHDLSVRGLAATTAAQRAAIAYAQTLLQLRRQGDVNAEEKAALASSMVRAEIEQQILRAQRDRISAGHDLTTRAQLELEIAGQSSTEQERQRAILAARLQLENEALQIYGARSAYDEKHLAGLTAQIDKQTEINKLIATQAALRDLQFEREQMGRSESEQRVYDRLNGLGMLTDGQIVSAQAEMIASQMRLNDVLKSSQSALTDFASSFLRDIKNGETATASLISVVDRLADRFLDMAVQQAVTGLFGAFTGGFGGFGGNLLTGVFHNGGVAGSPSQMRRVPAHVFGGAPRYHDGGIAGLRSNEVPAILERGERVIPNGADVGAALGGAFGGAALGGISIPININIDARNADAAGLARVEAQLAALQRNLPQQIIRTVANARQRGHV